MPWAVSRASTSHTSSPTVSRYRPSPPATSTTCVAPPSVATYFIGRPARILVAGPARPARHVGGLPSKGVAIFVAGPARPARHVGGLPSKGVAPSRRVGLSEAYRLPAGA